MVDLAGFDGDWHGRGPTGRAVRAEEHISELTLAWGEQGEVCELEHWVDSERER